MLKQAGFYPSHFHNVLKQTVHFRITCFPCVLSVCFVCHWTLDSCWTKHDLMMSLGPKQKDWKHIQQITKIRDYHLTFNLIIIPLLYHPPFLFSTWTGPVPWSDYVQITLHMPVSVHNVPLPVELHTTCEISTKCTCAVCTCKGNMENFSNISMKLMYSKYIYILYFQPTAF